MYFTTKYGFHITSCLLPFFIRPEKAKTTSLTNGGMFLLEETSIDCRLYEQQFVQAGIAVHVKEFKFN
jgi:hypothetical protein